MAPIAVAGEPHHLPGWPVHGQRPSACEAPARVKTNGARGERGGRSLAPEYLFGRKGGAIRTGSSEPLSCAKTAGAAAAKLRTVNSARRQCIFIPPQECAIEQTAGATPK